MKDRVLFVDDEPNVLDGIRRQLRNRVELETATSAAAGLDIIHKQGPFAVVVSDMRMPEMDGARFLAQVNEIAPQTVRMVLSGQADLESTIAAVNEGRVFRFLLKPCNSETLFGVIKNGIEQYRLIHAEKHLLENTLNATVKVLCDVLGLINPVAQRRAAQIQRYAESAAEALRLLPHLWQYHLAAMVSQLGCITLPQETLSRAISGQALSDEERRLYESHPADRRQAAGHDPAPRSGGRHGRGTDAGAGARSRQRRSVELGTGEDRRRHPVGRGAIRSPHFAGPHARSGRAAREPGRARRCHPPSRRPWSRPSATTRDWS